MATNAMPIHPRTGLHAVYQSPRSGRVFWPVFGGEESDEAAAQAAAAAAKAESDAKAAAEAKAVADAANTGFPANTPLEQMTVEQREAYWKHQARKHEDRVKAYNGKSPEQVAEAFEKAEKNDALEYELASDAEKKAADARKAAASEADAKYQPLLVKTEFKAAAAGRIEPDKLDTILEPLDLTKFLAADGTPDTDKVKAYVDGIAPATGNQNEQQRRGPSPTGQGHRPANTGKPSVEAGRERYLARHPAKQ